MVRRGPEIEGRDAPRSDNLKVCIVDRAPDPTTKASDTERSDPNETRESPTENEPARTAF